MIDSSVIPLPLQQETAKLGRGISPVGPTSAAGAVTHTLVHLPGWFRHHPQHTALLAPATSVLFPEEFQEEPLVLLRRCFGTRCSPPAWPLGLSIQSKKGNHDFKSTFILKTSLMSLFGGEKCILGQNGMRQRLVLAVTHPVPEATKVGDGGSESPVISPRLVFGRRRDTAASGCVGWDERVVSLPVSCG